MAISQPSRSFVAKKLSLNFAQYALYPLMEKSSNGMPAACVNTSLPQAYMMHMEKCAWGVHINYGKSLMSHILIFKW